MTKPRDPGGNNQGERLRGRANPMKYYTVQQTFESLGDAVPLRLAESHHETRADALAAAVQLRSDLATMIQEWEIIDNGDSQTGQAHEIEAWREAKRMSGSGRHYTAEAAAMIADRAVQITATEE